MRALVLLAALTLAACASDSGSSAPGGARMQWRCEGGKSFGARITTSGAQVSAGGQSYTLRHVQGSGARYSNGRVTYQERAGQATLSGAAGGPYANCRRG